MKNFSRTIFLILFFLVCLALSQRRGARSKTSSSISGSGHVGNHHVFGSKFAFTDSQNCETVNGVTTCTYNSKEKEMLLKTTFYVLGGALVFALYTHIRSK